ncbi:MAG: hypothetical protein HUJ96_00405 [Marinilabiliaceae bacterium]|nr:hypothetical protein [Marinilabiliaceae bacterium]
MVGHIKYGVMLLLLISGESSSLLAQFKDGDASKDNKSMYFDQESQYKYNKDLDGKKGRKSSVFREDQLFHSESAYVTRENNGNVSLLSYSRYGLSTWELSTCLATDAFRPMLFGKRKLKEYNKDNFLSMKVNFGTYYPMFALGQRMKIEEVADADADIPYILEIGNELLFSHIWSYDPNCSTGKPFMVLTIGIGTYGGVNFSDSPIRPVYYHFVAQRKSTACDWGFRGHLKGWVDGYVNSWLVAHGGLWIQAGMYLTHPLSAEVRGEAEFFLTPAFSAKLGVMGSFGNFEGVKNKAAVLPMFDLTYYFGRKKGISGLFELKL